MSDIIWYYYLILSDQKRTKEKDYCVLLHLLERLLDGTTIDVIGWSKNENSSTFKVLRPK